MNKQTQIFQYLSANPKGVSRKALVTFICQLNGRAYQQGYYGTNIQGWALVGYIKSKGEHKATRWTLDTLGKLYLSDRPTALLKARVNVLTNKFNHALSNSKRYREQVSEWRKDYRALDSVLDDYKDEVRELTAENNMRKEEGEFKGRDNESEIASTNLRIYDLQQENKELTACAHANILPHTFHLLETERDELEEALKDLTAKYDGLYKDYQDKLDAYGHFTKAELIAIIKGMIPR